MSKEPKRVTVGDIVDLARDIIDGGGISPENKANAEVLAERAARAGGKLAIIALDAWLRNKFGAQKTDQYAAFLAYAKRLGLPTRASPAFWSAAFHDFQTRPIAPR